MKYCKDCVHIEEIWMYGDPICEVHMKRILYEDPVRGKLNRETGKISCSSARSDGGICGPDAKLYIPIVPKVEQQKKKHSKLWHIFFREY